MKKELFCKLFSTLMLVVLFGFCLTACSGDEDDPPQLSVSQSLINLSCDGSFNSDIKVIAENTDWSVEVTMGRDWLTAYKNGDKVAVSAKENPETSERSGKILVIAVEDPRISCYIDVIQRGTSPYITVNGTDNDEHYFPGLFDNGKSGIDYKQVFKIKSNVQWSLTDKVDWLNISPTSGKDEVELSIYPINANNADVERTATVTLNGSGVSAIINIIQGAGKPLCYVLPANEVALYDRICWEFSATSNVNEYQYLLLTEWEYNRMSDREFFDEISMQEKLKVADDYVMFHVYDSHYNEITENTTYYLITLAYDKNGSAGDFKTTKIKTPIFMNVDDDAWVSFENVYSDLFSSFMFDAVKEGYCDNYHLIYGTCKDMYNSAMYAFQINYYLKNKKKHWYAETWNMEIVTNYPNNHTFNYTSKSYFIYDPICIAYGWGVFKDGKLSSDVVGFQWDTSTENVMRKAPSSREEKTGNFILRRSVEMEKVKKCTK